MSAGSGLPFSPIVYELDLGPSTFGLILNQLRSVVYTDPPVIAILLFHIIWFVVFILFQRDLVISSIQFTLSCFLIFITSSINSFGGTRWQSLHFSLNYFDPTCTFLFIFWVFPLALVSILITLTLFVDLCKAIAIRHYFRSILPKDVPEVPVIDRSDKAKTE
jgi:hypothetical protein